LKRAPPIGGAALETCDTKKGARQKSKLTLSGFPKTNRYTSGRDLEKTTRRLAIYHLWGTRILGKQVVSEVLHENGAHRPQQLWEKSGVNAGK
jgi:hypothetical protein